MAILPNEPIANFLNIVIIKTKLIELDLWSIVHFISGFFLMWLLSKLGLSQNQKYIIFPILLILYELFEIYFNGTLFRTETITNIVWDIIMGCLGGFIYLNM